MEEPRGLLSRFGKSFGGNAPLTEVKHAGGGEGGREVEEEMQEGEDEEGGGRKLFHCRLLS